MLQGNRSSLVVTVPSDVPTCTFDAHGRVCDVTPHGWYIVLAVRVRAKVRTRAKCMARTGLSLKNTIDFKVLIQINSYWALIISFEP